MTSNDPKTKAAIQNEMNGRALMAAGCGLLFIGVGVGAAFAGLGILLGALQ